jgi:hypothetical protein
MGRNDAFAIVQVHSLSGRPVIILAVSVASPHSFQEIFFEHAMAKSLKIERHRY